METKALSSSFLRKRGSCCKSNCLHCPFGRTLREIGVKIIAQDSTSIEVINHLISKLIPQNPVTNSLLAGAFGKQENYNNDQAYLLSLKDIPCGIAYVEGNKLIKHFLLDEFSDQGIDAVYLEGLLCE